MSSADLEPDRRPGDGANGIDGKLTGRGCDDLHRSAGPGSSADARGDGRLRFAWPDDLAATTADPDDLLVPGDDGMEGLAPPAARRHGTGQLGAGRGRRARPGGGIPRPRPGWYAYRVAGPAGLPSWATEVALTVERPVARPPAGPGAARVAELVQAMVLFRAAGRASWLGGVAEAVVEVETAAGLRPVGGVDLVAGIGSRLLVGPALPGLVPVAPAVARASLGAAGARGLPAPLRRWRPAVGEAEVSWQPSAGSVVTCAGPCGVSAQAVVALRGLGDVAAVTPPPGGALVLRAWEARRTWGVACGLVIGADAALGLGREAGRVAARARAEGWGAVVLDGATAMRLVRAGSPGQEAPASAAQAASGPRLAALFEACLAAGGLGRPAPGPRWALPVTP